MLRRGTSFVALTTTLTGLVGLGGCTERESFPDLTFLVFDAQGANPLNGRTLTNARAFFLAGTPGAVEDYADSAVEDGSFDIVVPIDDVASTMHVRLELWSAAGVELIGGTVPFFPAEATNVGVIVGEPGTCDPVAGLTIGTARGSMGVSLNGTYLLLSGGVGAAGSLRDADVVDLLGYTQYHLDDAAAALGATRAAVVSFGESVVVPADAPAYVHRVYAATGTDPRPAVTLHDGAALADAVLAVPGRGAVVIGGGPDAAPSDRVSWVLPQSGSSSNEVRTLTLAAAVPERAAAVADDGIWILSRGAGDATLEQLVDTTTAPILRLGGIPDGVRLGGLLVANEAGTEFLVLGGVDGGGVVRTDTLAIAGCPNACSVSPGPTWTNAREGVSVDPHGVLVGGTVGGVPSDLVERVRRAATGWIVDPVATLTRPRRGAGVLRATSGPVYVFGGQDATGYRNDVEVCFLSP